MLLPYFLDFSVGAGAFVIGLSQICSFFSYMYMYIIIYVTHVCFWHIDLKC